MKQPSKLKPNTIIDEKTGLLILSCAFGTAWLDHWGPPVGTGKGCAACDAV